MDHPKTLVSQAIDQKVYGINLCKKKRSRIAIFSVKGV